MINMISASVTPTMTFAQLEQYGFRLAIYPIVTAVSAMDAMMRALRALRDDQDDRAVAHLQTPKQLFELFDLAGWRDIADRAE
jgi:2-methylisocitrate lyase-like PEP mutase family enzyme